MKLIVGLGNPGLTYAHTRHNAGFMMIDRLASQLGAGAEKKQGQALVRQVNAGADRLLLVKPQAYMNLSGNPVWELIHFYKDAVEDFIIVHDDLDMPLGRLRFKTGGGAGGHKGLQSITARLGSDQYDRLKIGIGRPGLLTAETYVLQAFSPDERVILDQVLKIAAEGILCWLSEGCGHAMNNYNATDLAIVPSEDEGLGNRTTTRGEGT
ncbi:MAG: aminoacyl-tRNA hydrolase [Clostridiales bacterium]|nr:aminoacyl-tRNA hydrolase [Clostridiales bacterium]